MLCYYMLCYYSMVNMKDSYVIVVVSCPHEYCVIALRYIYTERMRRWMGMRM